MKKIALLALALVLALGSLGVAYALWYDDLYITGQVDTGSIGAYWTCFATGDSEPDGKNYSSVSCSVGQTTETDDTLTMTITNAYPCIDYWVIADIHASGTLPIHVCDLQLDMSSIENVGSYFVFACDANGNPIMDGDKYTAVQYPIQIHPDGDPAYIGFWVHFNNSLPEDTVVDDTDSYEFTFTGKLYYQQWNEACVTYPYTPG
jgi:hypothetical protein